MTMTATMRVPTMLASIFMVVAVGFAGFYFVAERISPDLAMKRYERLAARDNHQGAVIHGERALNLLLQAEERADDLHDLQLRLARTHILAGNYERAANLLETVLSTGDWRSLPPSDRLIIEKDLAAAHILAGEYAKGVSIFSSFLELAGDAVIQSDHHNGTALQQLYADAVYESAGIFAVSLKPTLGPFTLKGDAAGQLAIAAQMVDLGAYYALHQETLSAATGLLSAAYITQAKHLPEHARDLTRAAMILGPVYLKTKRYDDAETLYLRAFHAQEQLLGADSPDFSLYIKLLAEVYHRQGRLTEANALTQHMRSIFQENYGRLRHSIARQTPERLVRAIAPGQLPPANYQPTDLVTAASYLIPVSNTQNKAGNKAPISISLAADNGSDNAAGGDASMPVRLAQLMTLCAGQDRDEALSLARGFHVSGSPQSDEQTPPSPAEAEHQLGLAIDLNVNGRLMRQSDASWLCFRENAWQFGFILSFPQGSEDYPDTNSYEPWHWRYVGLETARLYREIGPLLRPQEFLANIDCFKTAARVYEANRQFSAPPETSACLKPPLAATNPSPLLGNADTRQQIEQTETLIAAAKATKLAFANGPAFAARGRLEEARALYISALREQDGLNGPSLLSHALPAGMLADLYDREGRTLHATALKQHMLTVIRDAYQRHDHHTHSHDHSKTANLFPYITRPVSQHFVLQADYQPEDLVPANDHGIAVSKDPRLDEMKLRLVAENQKQDTSTADTVRNLPLHLAELMTVCTQQSEGETISLRSGFRAYATQLALYQRLRHRGTVTPPGMSEHQTGLAADIDVDGRFMREDDAAFQCFMDNAHHFGFILSYPKGNTYLPTENSFEPWHWRYVGIDTATLYKSHGPDSKPQEFLAAVDCYRNMARARAEFFPDDRTDYCLYQDEAITLLSLEGEPFAEKTPSENTSLVNKTNTDAARILNTPLRSGNNR